MAFQLFGFTFGTAEEKAVTLENQKSFVVPQNDDGAVTVQTGSYYGTYVDLDGVVRNEIELVTRYREMALQPELETAIDEIVNEAIVVDDAGNSVDIDLDKLEIDESVKERIQAEFERVLEVLNFNDMGHEIFKRWYIDGRLHFQAIIDERAPDSGIQEARYIDPRRIRKIREIQRKKDPITGMDLIANETEYYLYNERGIIGTHSNLGTRIASDSVVSVTSGLMDSRRAMVLSYLHKAIKPLNQLRMVEDATVIYRLSRAPERRVFYIDVGNMPTPKVEQYLKSVMDRYRNKLVYDASTGEIKDDRKHLSMLEDIWLPRREGSRGTEISTLEGGQNLGKMEDVEYFEKKLYKSLGVPIGRLEPQQGFSLGRSNEITRDELKFYKFIQRLRNKFATLFDELLRIQLVLTRVCTQEEWDQFREKVFYKFKSDVNFNEMKEAELLMSRVSILQLVDPFVGRYYSMEWVKKNILMQEDDEMKEIAAQIEAEIAAMPPMVDPMTGQPLPPGTPGVPAPAGPQMLANIPSPVPVAQSGPAPKQEAKSSPQKKNK